MLVGKNVQGQSADVLAAVVVVVDRGKGSTLHQGVGDLRRKVVGRRRHHVGQVPHPAVVARRRRALAHNVAANGVFSVSQAERLRLIFNQPGLLYNTYF